MFELYGKKLIGAVLLGLVIFGGVRCINFLSEDSMRATDQLEKGLRK